MRLIRDGEKGKGVWRWGEREIIDLSLHCHHQNDFCIYNVTCQFELYIDSEQIILVHFISRCDCHKLCKNSTQDILFLSVFVSCCFGRYGGTFDWGVKRVFCLC